MQNEWNEAQSPVKNAFHLDEYALFGGMKIIRQC